MIIKLQKELQKLVLEAMQTLYIPGFRYIFNLIYQCLISSGTIARFNFQSYTNSQIYTNKKEPEKEESEQKHNCNAKNFN